MATPKNTTHMFHGKNDPPLPSRKVANRIGLQCSVFSKPLIGQGCTEKYYICDINILLSIGGLLTEMTQTSQ